MTGAPLQSGAFFLLLFRGAADMIEPDFERKEMRRE